jgi:hypothetical protein
MTALMNRAAEVKLSRKKKCLTVDRQPQRGLHSFLNTELGLSAPVTVDAKDAGKYDRAPQSDPPIHAFPQNPVERQAAMNAQKSKKGYSARFSKSKFGVGRRRQPLP